MNFFMNIDMRDRLTFFSSNSYLTYEGYLVYVKNTSTGIICKDSSQIVYFSINKLNLENIRKFVYDGKFKWIHENVEIKSSKEFQDF